MSMLKNSKNAFRLTQKMHLHELLKSPASLNAIGNFQWAPCSFKNIKALSIVEI